MMMWEAVAALLLGGAVLWLLLGPLLRPEAVRPAPLEPEDPLETRRGQSLAALKELDFDRAMGRLSDADYASLRAAYTAEALAALRDEAEPEAAADPAEALIAARARSVGVSASCRRCGPRPEADSRFCSECGGALGTSECPGCGALLRPDGRFCDQCGTAAAA
jgi:hypothetical protein